MPIPNDPDHRWWVDATAQNPNEVNDLRNALIAFVAFSHGREPSLEGSGFIIAGNSSFALAITAKHVLVEGVSRKQRPLPLHAPSAIFVGPSSTIPSISPEMLRVLWGGSQHTGMMNVMHVGYNESLDAACCVIVPQDEPAQPFHPTSLPIDTAVPSMGALIHMVSQDNMVASEIVPPTEASGEGQIISFSKRISLRVGVVTGIYPGGLRHYSWPCFTTSIPAEPGMSGGLVILPREGKTKSACGIVCADNSTPEARADWAQCGESIIACAWPLLTLCAPVSIPSAPSTPTRTLYEFMQRGDIDVAVGGIDHIDLIKMGNGDFRIGFKGAAPSHEGT